MICVRTKVLVKDSIFHLRWILGHRRTAIATPTAALVVSAILLATGVGFASFGLTSDHQSATNPCETSAGLSMPGVSVVTSNGIQKCVVGPPIVTYPDGRVDFRNGTVVNLHANLTGAALINGGANDTVILPNGTRFTFNSNGIIVTTIALPRKSGLLQRSSSWTSLYVSTLSTPTFN